MGDVPVLLWVPTEGQALGKKINPVFHAVTFVAGFNDVAIVTEPIKERCGHFTAIKYLRPFRKGKIRRDDPSCPPFLEKGM